MACCLAICILFNFHSNPGDKLYCLLQTLPTDRRDPKSTECHSPPESESGVIQMLDPAHRHSRSPHCVFRQVFTLSFLQQSLKDTTERCTCRAGAAKLRTQAQMLLPDVATVLVQPLITPSSPSLPAHTGELQEGRSACLFQLCPHSCR